ncbi:MAG: methyltransferase [Pseudonocardiales bacterium]|nr:methyltransferase [Pseudonocardiales bacterium]
MVLRSLSFGSVASAYERFRPGYPDELVDEVLAYAGRAVGTALEIGAGTGKATRVFSARGIAVTATDPDREMLAELRRHVPMTVLTIPSRFEDLPLNSTYDLVFAAAALHWTEPTHRWPRVAALLNPGGTFASFGGQVGLADSAIEAVVRAARSPFLDSDDIPSPDGTSADNHREWPGTELAQSDLFIDVCLSILERRTTMSARDYVGYLSTVSAYLQLPAPVRAEALDRIMKSLPADVSVIADLTLHLARTPPSVGAGVTRR